MSVDSIGNVDIGHKYRNILADMEERKLTTYLPVRRVLSCRSLFNFSL